MNYIPPPKTLQQPCPAADALPDNLLERLAAAGVKGQQLELTLHSQQDQQPTTRNYIVNHDNDLKKFRVTFSWVVVKEMSRVIEASDAEEAEEIAEELDDDEGWEISEGEGEIGSDETTVEEVPANPA